MEVGMEVIFQAWAGGRFDLYLESRIAPLTARQIRPLLTLQDGVTYVHPVSERARVGDA